jgi:hypothetical protein
LQNSDSDLAFDIFDQFLSRPYFIFWAYWSNKQFQSNQFRFWKSFQSLILIITLQTFFFGKTWIYIRGFTKFSIKVAWSLQFLGYLRTLGLKFQKAQTKIEVFLALPCWLSQLNWDSQQGRKRKISILLESFWNFKLKVLKYPKNCRPHATLVLKVYKKSWIG